MSEPTTSPLPAGLLEQARESVLQSQSPTISHLQAQLRLPYSQATEVMFRLEQEGLVLPPWPGRDKMLNPRYRRMHVRVVAGNPRAVYVRRVVETALFFFEMHEENNAGDTRAIDLIKPMPSARFSDLRVQFLSGWYGRDHLSLTDAALAFHRWLLEKGCTPAEAVGCEAAIQTECLPHERAPRFDHDTASRQDRALLRLARYYRQILSEGLSHHTRVAEYFVHPSFIPRGQSRAGIGHEEHVVPCAVLRDTAIRYYLEERPINDVVTMLKNWLVIVRITPDERDRLDKGPHALKDSMPLDWDEERDCIYMRLHDKKVAFDAPAQRPCTCGEA